jgi:hypothetical protein
VIADAITVAQTIAELAAQASCGKHNDTASPEKSRKNSSLA